MRIVVRVVPRSLLEALYLTTRYIPSQMHLPEWTFCRDSDDAIVFPSESHAQAAIDGFMAQRQQSEYHCDIQDADDAERGALEPIWTGPDYSPQEDLARAKSLLGAIFPDMFKGA